ncbi:trimeric intracellular cation channel family protein [Sporosarcina sp. Marseille-Q4063]|uniref:trimeric intracellular cation channel family protein n=1 Tax=Sporosarcina sp. Marseille-Q4063 TaxID=2810514 RepID=UPI001BAFD042|nr:trimeric intracellular cation channel family protein [Sporosarcina sp. Marseille-Q4063]QUW21916.1 trimeric intracellular cation channel family protein [Sporosarcina sp. Marseille-Q4063]
MAWDVFSFIGTFAFAISGAIIAMEEEYDLFGVYILGVVTAFGGGAIRNLLIGLPSSALWDQGFLFQVAIVSITIIFLFPNNLINHWERWGTYFDAVGLSAFAIQGAMFAVSLDLPLSAVIVAAVLTGSGGGIIRDLLAGRRPLVFKREIYAVWAAGGGLLIGLGIFKGDIALYFLLVIITGLRILSLIFHWRHPLRKIKTVQEKNGTRL